jgi:uncharacterized protein YqeY
MTLKEQLDTAMKEAMRAKDALRLSAIRMAKTAITNKEKESGAAVDDQTVIGVLSTLAKQRRESAQAYRDGDRPEMAEKEEQELAVLLAFLPAQLGADELRALVAETAAAIGAASMKDMGRLMKELTEKTRGRADGKLVSELVKLQLQG